MKKLFLKIRSAASRLNDLVRQVAVLIAIGGAPTAAFAGNTAANFITGLKTQFQSGFTFALWVVGAIGAIMICVGVWEFMQTSNQQNRDSTIKGAAYKFFGGALMCAATYWIDTMTGTVSGGASSFTGF